MECIGNLLIQKKGLIMLLYRFKNSFWLTLVFAVVAVGYGQCDGDHVFKPTDWLENELPIPGYVVLEFTKKAETNPQYIPILFSPVNGDTKQRLYLQISNKTNHKEGRNDLFGTCLAWGDKFYYYPKKNSYLLNESTDFRVELNQYQQTMTVWSRPTPAEGKPAVPYTTLLTYPDWDNPERGSGKLDKSTEVLRAYPMSNFADRINFVAIGRGGDRITNVKQKSILLRQELPGVPYRVDTGGDMHCPSFFDAWQLPVVDEGVVECTADLNPSPNQNPDQSSMCFCFVPEPASGVNALDNALRLAVFNDRVEMAIGNTPGTVTNIPGGTMTPRLAPGVKIINNKAVAPDTGTVPIDVRFTISRARGTIRIETKAQGADASTYAIIFDYMEGDPLPGQKVAANVFSLLKGNLKYFSFSAYYAMSLWSNVAISKVQTAAPSEDKSQIQTVKTDLVEDKKADKAAVIAIMYTAYTSAKTVYRQAAAGVIAKEKALKIANYATPVNPAAVTTAQTELTNAKTASAAAQAALVSAQNDLILATGATGATPKAKLDAAIALASSHDLILPTGPTPQAKPDATIALDSPSRKTGDVRGGEVDPQAAQAEKYNLYMNALRAFNNAKTPKGKSDKKKRLGAAENALIGITGATGATDEAKLADAIKKGSAAKTAQPASLKPRQVHGAKNKPSATVVKK